MRIVASNVQLSSAHLFEARQSTTERLQVRVGPGGREAHGHDHQDQYLRGADGESRDIQKLVRLLEKYLSGKTHEDPNKIADKIDALVKRIEAAQAGGSERTATEQDAPARFDLRYTRTESYQEAEATSFRASGSVATADGRQIDFTQALDLARVYARTETISLRATGTIDPNAVAGPATGVPAPAAPAGPAPVAAAPAAATPAAAAPATQQALSLGGSVLGIDANGDGQIDAKTELVGQSGNGFAELAKYDQDGNGFIDAGDPIFAKLALVDRSANGLTATTLAAKGVGAIYTGSVATPYTVTDSSNQATAQIARSGIFINENGTTGIAQQVNVLV